MLLQLGPGGSHELGLKLLIHPPQNKKEIGASTKKAEYGSCITATCFHAAAQAAWGRQLPVLPEPERKGET